MSTAQTPVATPTAPVPIYELARELGVPAKELVRTVRKMGLQAKSHMSRLSPKEATQVRKTLAETSPKAEKPTSHSSSTSTNPRDNAKTQSDTAATSTKEGHSDSPRLARGSTAPPVSDKSKSEESGPSVPATNTNVTKRDALKRSKNATPPNNTNTTLIPVATSEEASQGAHAPLSMTNGASGTARLPSQDTTSIALKDSDVIFAHQPPVPDLPALAVITPPPFVPDSALLPTHIESIAKHIASSPSSSLGLSVVGQSQRDSIEQLQTALKAHSSVVQIKIDAQHEATQDLWSGLTARFIQPLLLHPTSFLADSSHDQDALWNEFPFCFAELQASRMEEASCGDELQALHVQLSDLDSAATAAKERTYLVDLVLNCSEIDSGLTSIAECIGQPSLIRHATDLRVARSQIENSISGMASLGRRFAAIAKGTYFQSRSMTLLGGLGAALLTGLLAFLFIGSWDAAAQARIAGAAGVGLLTWFGWRVHSVGALANSFRATLQRYATMIERLDAQSQQQAQEAQIRLEAILLHRQQLLDSREQIRALQRWAAKRNRDVLSGHFLAGLVADGSVRICEIQQGWQRLATGFSGRIVLMVDALPDCPPQRAAEVLDAVRFFMTMENVVTIVPQLPSGTDTRLLQRYEELALVPLTLGAPNVDIVRHCLSRGLELNDSETHILGHMGHLVHSKSSAIQLINAYRLLRATQDTPQHSEQELTILLAIALHCPEQAELLFAKIAEHPKKPSKQPTVLWDLLAKDNPLAIALQKVRASLKEDSAASAMTEAISAYRPLIGTVQRFFQPGTAAGSL